MGLTERVELNGKCGDVVGYDEQADEYTVQAQSPPVVVAVKRRHCILREGTSVILSGLSQDRFNLQMARIVTVHRDAARYTVRSQSGDTIKVRYDKVLC